MVIYYIFKNMKRERNFVCIFKYSKNCISSVMEEYGECVE